MTYDEKMKFVADLMESMKGRMLTQVQFMPEEWDGIELRQYITEYVEDQADASSYLNKRSSRYRGYKNAKIVHNL